jgi:NAD(P)-dependent dehydrogenase (short-subunit alcohol dehydrogenase family)
MTSIPSKVALVTGAGRGIGRALAVGLARLGYNIVAADLSSQATALAETVKEVEDTGHRAYAKLTDVASKESVNACVWSVLEEAGRIDVLVNNAGILRPSLLQDLSEKSWDDHFNINAKGVLLMCQAVLPHMRARKSGRVINIASIAGRQGVPTQGHYAATKSTVITLTRVLAQEVGMDGVTVNAICPGIILTEMGRSNLGSEAAIRHWEEVAALKRLGAPEDIVGPVCFSPPISRPSLRVKRSTCAVESTFIEGDSDRSESALLRPGPCFLRWRISSRKVRNPRRICGAFEMTCPPSCSRISRFRNLDASPKEASPCEAQKLKKLPNSSWIGKAISSPTRKSTSRRPGGRRSCGLWAIANRLDGEEPRGSSAETHH